MSEYVPGWGVLGPMGLGERGSDLLGNVRVASAQLK